jgi:hypothetical protein
MDIIGCRQGFLESFTPTAADDAFFSAFARKSIPRWPLKFSAGAPIITPLTKVIGIDAMYTKKPFEHEDLPGDDPQDRRTVKRRHLIYYLRVWDRDSGDLLGHVVDITTEGMMLISEKKLPLKKNFSLEIRWHDPVGDEDQVIAFEAQSMWSSTDVNKAFFDTGLRLLDDAEDVLQPIRALIQRYGFKD